MKLGHFLQLLRNEINLNWDPYFAIVVLARNQNLLDRRIWLGNRFGCLFQHRFCLPFRGHGGLICVGYRDLISIY